MSFPRGSIVVATCVSAALLLLPGVGVAQEEVPCTNAVTNPIEPHFLGWWQMEGTLEDAIDSVDGLYTYDGTPRSQSSEAYADGKVGQACGVDHAVKIPKDDSAIGLRRGPG